MTALNSRAAGFTRAHLRELLAFTAFCFVLLSARWSLANHYVVPTPSMEPTVMVGDHVLVDETAFGLRVPFTDWRVTDGQPPRRGDVVVLESPEDGITLLKRVVAVPGDVVAVRRGAVLVHGVHTAFDAEVANLRHGGGSDLGPLQIPDDQYLVMGDNRGQSHDGRAFGLVRRDDVFGRAVGVVWRDGGPRWERL